MNSITNPNHVDKLSRPAWSPPPVSLHEARQAAILRLIRGQLRYRSCVRLDAATYRLLKHCGYTRVQIDRAIGNLVEGGRLALVPTGSGAVGVVVPDGQEVAG